MLFAVNYSNYIYKLIISMENLLTEQFCNRPFPKNSHLPGIQFFQLSLYNRLVYLFLIIPHLFKKRFNKNILLICFMCHIISIILKQICQPK